MGSKYFIGTIELSVHLSSMNPLGYIDERSAHTELERALLKACLEAFKNSETKSDLETHGIVTIGAVQKYFRFSEFKDVLLFSDHLRSILLEKRLPFKICIGRGEISSGGISDEWNAVLTEYEETKSEEIARKLTHHFSTSDPSLIRQLFKLYKSPSYHDDIIQLGLDLQNFKGLGTYFSFDLQKELSKQAADRTFLNFFPVQRKSREYEKIGFLDVKFPFSEYDVIYRYKDSDTSVETTAGFGSESEVLIDGLLDQFNHSYSARKDSTVFFVSALINVVRSSNFRKLRFFEKPEHNTENGITLQQGWQYYPPIFHVLFAPNNKPKLKAMPGIDMVVASLVDQIFADSTNSVPSSSIASEKSEINIEFLDEGLENAVRTLLSRLIVQFGEVYLRNLFVQPNEILCEQRKKKILRMVSN